MTVFLKSPSPRFALHIHPLQSRAVFAGQVEKTPTMHLIVSSQQDEGSGAALWLNLSVPTLVGVGDGLPCPRSDCEGVGGSTILRAAVGRSGRKTVGKVTKKQRNHLFIFKMVILY